MTLQDLFYLSPVQFIAAIFILVAFIAVISLAAKSLFGAGDVEGRNRGAKDRGAKDRGGRNGVTKNRIARNGITRNGITRSDDLLGTPFEAKSYDATTAATIQRLKAENYELKIELKAVENDNDLLMEKTLKSKKENVLLRAANRRLTGEVERLRTEMERMRVETEGMRPDPKEAARP